MVVAAIVVARWARLRADGTTSPRSHPPRSLGTVLRMPAVLLMGVTSALLTAIQTGLLVFLFPLYLLQRGGVSPEVVGFLVGLGVLGRLVALWLGGSGSDRGGGARGVTAGVLTYAGVLGRGRVR